MKTSKTPIEGLFTISLDPHTDNRGFFLETFRMSELKKMNPSLKPFVQGCHSHSAQGVLRGLHAEPWDKLVYVVQGEVFTAVVDLRKDSSTFGKVCTFNLGEKNRMAVYVPNGLAHGFMALSSTADYSYLFTEEYSNKPRIAVMWNDPHLNIRWPMKDPIVSDADSKNETMKNLFPEKFK